jgi:hypothetical protein
MLPLGMVIVEAGAPGRGRPLPGRKTRDEARARHRRTTRGGYDRARRGETHRRAMGTGAPPAATAEGRDRQTTQRPPHRLERHPVGGEDRIVVARCPRSTASGRVPTDATSCG